MNKQQFIEKWNEEYGFSVSDVLLRINSNLSDFQSGTLQDLNGLKEYISDYRSLIKHEEMTQRYREDERREFYDHLGRYY
jgi:hypothetical protein